MDGDARARRSVSTERLAWEPRGANWLVWDCTRTHAPITVLPDPTRLCSCSCCLSCRFLRGQSLLLRFLRGQTLLFSL